MPNYKIEPNSALLIIDAQQEYSNSNRPLFTSDFNETVLNINKISQACRQQKIPVFIVKHLLDRSGRNAGRMADFISEQVFIDGEQYAESDSSVVVDESDIVIEKTRYSAFINTNLEAYLKSLGINTVLVTGFMTGYCSVTTARHAHDLDYQVIYINDANSGPTFGNLGFGEVSVEDIKRVVATLLAGGVAEVIDTNEAINRITKAQVSV
ncbi:isochorismatase hydrolase [Crinalium epipsammum PCC 9333]|uniref:Isochorismatase hydrolase n=1 Tax=Crinalium epipsammum PCC 9333 TaxID=1173022 RepID=K9W1M5_9CYAN|nr:isochorismatase family protein [Crinalium epipsammum]AFZ13637.1 isochorismatase hydrolase [Crinalium epipsammum PCC 9333]